VSEDKYHIKNMNNQNGFGIDIVNQTWNENLLCIVLLEKYKLAYLRNF